MYGESQERLKSCQTVIQSNSVEEKGKEGRLGMKSLTLQYKYNSKKISTRPTES